MTYESKQIDDIFGVNDELIEIEEAFRPLSPLEVEDEGVSLTTRTSKMNFAGAGVTVTEPDDDEVLVTIPGGGGGGMWTLLDTQTIGDQATVDFTGLSSTYKAYKFVLLNVTHGETSGQTLHCRVGTGATPTWVTSSSYEITISSYSSNVAAETHTRGTATQAAIHPLGVAPDTDAGVSGELTLYDPADTVKSTRWNWAVTYDQGTGELARSDGTAKYDAITPVTGFRFYFPGFNLESGVIKMYGLN